MKIDDSSSLLSFRSKKKGRASHSKILRPTEKSFAKPIDYYTYQLKNKFQWYDSKITLSVAKLVKKQGSLLKATDFEEMDPISISAL